VEYSQILDDAVLLLVKQKEILLKWQHSTR
jgi:hypothetical protein